MTETNSRADPCPKCRQSMHPGTVRTVLWIGDQIILVENIPAMVCNSCAEQYYDEEIQEALLRFTEQGFPGAEKTREIVVPVYTIKRRPPPAKEEEKVWLNLEHI